MRTLLLTLASLLTLAACDGSGALGPDFETELTTLGGCGDVVFYAVDGADELMLSFLVDGLVSEARTAGEETTTTFELPDAAVALILEEGTRVSDAMCDDVIENDGPQIHRTWTATSGTATVTIRPHPTQEGATADLFLHDVVFEREGGPQVVLERFEWTDTSVGWYAG
jgi:hypothetical protein